MRFPAKITSSCIWVAIPVDWVILHWFAFGADGWVGTRADGHVITKFYRMGRFLHFLTHGATLRTLRSRKPRYGTHNWSLQNTAQFLIRVPDGKIESKCNFRWKNLILESRLSLPSLVPTVFFWKPGEHVMDTWSSLEERNSPLTGKSVPVSTTHPAPVLLILLLEVCLTTL